MYSRWFLVADVLTERVVFAGVIPVVPFAAVLLLLLLLLFLLSMLLMLLLLLLLLPLLLGSTEVIIIDSGDVVVFAGEVV